MRLILATLALCALPCSAFAQSSGWEVEGSAGISLSRLPSGGDLTLPPAGATITTTSVLFPSRSVPSWFFGDGAALLNGVNTQFGLAQLTPLDAALGSVGLNSAAGAAFGVRVRRGLSPKWALEFSLDVMRGSADITDELVDAAETTRASFAPAFAALLGTAPELFPNPQIAATLDGPNGTSRDVALTGALVRTFAPIGAFSPYLTMGGGVLSSSGSPSLTLTGHYQFSVAGIIPISETDVLTLRAQQDRKLIGLLGGGVRRDLSPRLGLRIDGRVLIGGQGSRLLVDATPDVARGTPADFIESFTNPAIQFSSDPSSGRRSTLGDPGLDSFAVFSGTGVQIRVIASASVYLRF